MKDCNMDATVMEPTEAWWGAAIKKCNELEDLARKEQGNGRLRDADAYWKQVAAIDAALDHHPKVVGKVVAVNNFVLRQTAESRFSHFDGEWHDLAALVRDHLRHGKPGYKDGVLLVPVPEDGFFSGVVEVTPETKLEAAFTARREGEEPFVQVVAVGGEKLPAKVVEIVLYRHDVLGDEAVTDAEWEIVSINARATEEPEPLTPMAMARNFLESPGGTTAAYTAIEFARSIEYWSKRAMRD